MSRKMPDVKSAKNLTDKQKLKNARKTILSKSQKLEEALKDLEKLTSGCEMTKVDCLQIRTKWNLEEFKKKSLNKGSTIRRRK